MKKLTSLSVIAGLAMVLTTMSASAQFIGPNPNRYPRYPYANEENCADKMGHMRRVSSADIQAVRPGQHVGLIPVCEDLTVPGKNNYGSLFVYGNVSRLRVPLGRNPVLMQALVAKGYDQHDVISLRFGANDSIILYVHQRDMN